MFKTFLTTLIATVITSLIAISIINPGFFYDLKNNLFSNINLFNIINNVSTQDDTLPNDFLKDVSSPGSPTTAQDLFIDPAPPGQEREGREEALLYTSGATKEAERLIQEALAHSDYEKRYILNGIIEEYNLQMEAIFNELDSIERAKQRENISAILSIINRHIFIWDPYYYFVHSESQTPIAKTSTNLKNKHKELMRLLAALDSQETGRIATSYIKFLIEDIAKSGRRNNSDFVRFSYANYQTYRRFFDELVTAHTDFERGFAEEFSTLFDSFYNMHRDVHPSHSKEVRISLDEMRKDLVLLHRNSLEGFDKQEARNIVDNILSILKSQLNIYTDNTDGVLDFIQTDIQFYERF